MPYIGFRCTFSFFRSFFRFFVRSYAFLGLVLATLVVAVGTKAANAEPLVLLKQNSKPKYFVDNSGLCGEIYQRLVTKLGERGVDATVDSDLYPIKRILRKLELGQAHVFCGAGRNAKREAVYVYSALPVYEVANVIAAHDEEAFAPDGFPALISEGSLVGALFGTSSSTWLMSHEGVRVNDNFHSVEEGLEALASKRIQFFYYHDLGLNYLTENLNLPLKVVPTRFRSTPQWLLYSPHTPTKLIQEMDDAIAELTASGELQQIQKRYLIQ